MPANIVKNGVRYFVCCLCDDIFQGNGNNPEPVTDLEGRPFNDEQECCDNCNSIFVIPARMEEMGL